MLPLRHYAYSNTGPLRAICRSRLQPIFELKPEGLITSGGLLRDLVRKEFRNRSRETRATGGVVITHHDHRVRPVPEDLQLRVDPAACAPATVSTNITLAVPLPLPEPITVPVTRGRNFPRGHLLCQLRRKQAMHLQRARKAKQIRR